MAIKYIELSNQDYENIEEHKKKRFIAKRLTITLNIDFEIIII